MDYQQEIDDMLGRLEKLTSENELDPVMSRLVNGICGILERRGMVGQDIPSYLGSTANRGVPWVFPRETVG